MFDLKQKVALVTGSSRGLGWAMAQSLASAGAHVVLNARDGAALDARTAELRAQGLAGEAAPFDVNDAAAAEACIAAIAARHGRLDILVANAGINHRAPIGAFERADFELAADGISVNCIAPGFFATEMNAPLLANAEFNDWVCKRTPAGR